MNVDEKDPNFWEAVLTYWPQYIAASIVGGVGYLIRTVFTNQKKLIKLETEIAEREEAAHRGREELRELRIDVREMNANLLKFFSNKHN